MGTLTSPALSIVNQGIIPTMQRLALNLGDIIEAVDDFVQRASGSASMGPYEGGQSLDSGDAVILRRMDAYGPGGRNMSRRDDYSRDDQRPRASRGGYRGTAFVQLQQPEHCPQQERLPVLQADA
jgi:hypothetical protein